MFIKTSVFSPSPVANGMSKSGLKSNNDLQPVSEATPNKYTSTIAEKIKMLLQKNTPNGDAATLAGGQGSSKVQAGKMTSL